jgi:membrane-associated protease RseP (regulator of RpoE activity)
MLAWKLAAAAATVLLAATAARPDEAPPATGVGAVQTEAGSGAAPTVSAERGEYWLGLFASRPSPALQAHLKLPNSEGLLVEALQPASPAAKAGLEQYDVLLKGNGKPLADVGDLVRLINQVKGGKLTLELLRAGKRETVTVTPAKRPAHGPVEMVPRLWVPEGAILGGMRKFDPNLVEGQSLEFQIIRPGQILPPGSPMPPQPGGGPTSVEITVQTKAKLADGSKVEITRHGAEPAKVVVTHDKDKWEGTSGDLSKIPEKIRPEVEKLLRTAFDHFHVLATPSGPAISSGNGRPDVEKRLSEMQKQIDELRQSIKALRSSAKSKAAAKPE